MSDLLYRVVDDGSCVKFDLKTGFTAADIWTAFDPEGDPRWARDVIELHSDRNNRISTPLISMTGSVVHAWKLACDRQEQGHIDIHVALIDRDALKSQVEVYRMLDLVDGTNAEIAPKSCSWWDHVCVHRIPINAVVRFFTQSEFERYLASDDEHESNGEDKDWEEEEDPSSPLESEEEEWQIVSEEEWQNSF